MKEVIINLHGIEMMDFEARDYVAKMVVCYSIDGERVKKCVNFDLTRRAESIVQSILTFLKSQADLDINEDDIVSSLFVKRFVNEEKIEERLVNYFAKLCENVRFLKINKNHANYMKLYDQIKISKISLD